MLGLRSRKIERKRHHSLVWFVLRKGYRREKNRKTDNLKCANHGPRSMIGHPAQFRQVTVSSNLKICDQGLISLANRDVSLLLAAGEINFARDYSVVVNSTD